MKTSLLALGLLLAALSPVPAFGQDSGDAASNQVDAAVAEPFSGKIVFHQKEGPVIYEVTVANGQVSGFQHFANEDKPIARFVGGWFDFKQGRLSLLIQCTDDISEVYRSQCQQFHIDLKTREVTLDHMLFGYGRTVDDPEIGKAHVLDSLDAATHLVKKE